MIHKCECGHLINMFRKYDEVKKEYIPVFYLEWSGYLRTPITHCEKCGRKLIPNIQYYYP